MTDTASLVVRVNSTGVEKTNRDLGGLAKAAAGAAAAVVSLDTATQVFKALVDTQRNFDKLNSSLITVTGSSENAAKAFTVLQQFAKETPYGLNQAVEGFTKLVALGLNPSREALISYGNTAAAMGKDLNQMIEAVADASTMEFERLKEFGIKAKQEGDNVSFTFQGVTTTVKKNSEEIQEYLLNIGNVNFAGAMEVRAQTLDGALSSLQDTVEGLALATAQSGFGDIVAEQAREAEDAVQQLTDAIASGEILATLQDWVTLFNESFSFISNGLNSLAYDTSDASSDMSGSLSEIPDAIRDWLPTIQQTAKDMVDYFHYIDAQASAVAKSVAAAFTPGESAADTYRAATQAAEEALEAAYARNQAEAEGIRQRSYDRKKEAEENRKNYQERKNQEIDLSTFVTNKPGSSSDGGSAAGASESTAKAEAKAYDRQKKSAEDFYNTVLHLNDDAYQKIDAKQQERLESLNMYYQQQLLTDQQYEDAKTSIALEADTARAELLKEQKDKRQQEEDEANQFLSQIMAANEGELAEMDRQNEVKLSKLQGYYDQGLIMEEQFQAAKNAIAQQGMLQSVQYTANQFEQVATNMASAMQEGSKEAKAAAIAAATVAAISSAVQAYQSAAAIPFVGWIMGPIAAAAALAAGMANVQKIRSTPAREQGGNLNANAMAMVGERNKAEFIMPAGQSRVRTAEQMRDIMGGGKSQSATDNVTIVNNTSAQIGQARTERDDEGRLRIIIEEHVAASLQDSNSRISKSRRATRGQPGFA